MNVLWRRGTYDRKKGCGCVLAVLIFLIVCFVISVIWNIHYG